LDTLPAIRRSLPPEEVVAGGLFGDDDDRSGGRSTGFCLRYKVNSFNFNRQCKYIADIRINTRKCIHI
jgi:hypothetical protein